MFMSVGKHKHAKHDVDEIGNKNKGRKRKNM